MKDFEQQILTNIHGYGIKAKIFTLIGISGRLLQTYPMLNDKSEIQILYPISLAIALLGLVGSSYFVYKWVKGELKLQEIRRRKNEVSNNEIPAPEDVIN